MERDEVSSERIISTPEGGLSLRSRCTTIQLFHQPMSSPVFSIVDIAGAGRGVIASEDLSTHQIVLESEPPATHVIFHQYRKEVCARCFHYDRGRSLPVRLNSAGKVFCSQECQNEWLKDQGEIGLAAWEILQLFLKTKSKAITNASGLPLLAPKPDIKEIASKWMAAEETAQKLRRQLRRPANGKQPQPFQHILSKPWCQAVEADILSYLLSGILFHHTHLSKYQSDILPLAMDPTPYRSPLDLSAHCNSYVQLAAILPAPLLDSCAPEICQTLINAASHNSFGIRSGSEDGDEYMGYALYPGASYFNHSCSPNIAKTREGNVWDFRASRTIGVGEECCITYLGGDEKEMNVRQRRQRLKEYWGFECMCLRCKEERDL